VRLFSRKGRSAGRCVPCGATPFTWVKNPAKRLVLGVLFASAAVPLSIAQQKPMPHARGNQSDIVRRRQNWFYAQRSYPLGYIPRGARLRALQHLEEMRKRETAENASLLGPGRPQALTGVNLSRWVPLGPQPTNSLFFSPFTSGRVTALMTDPCDSTGQTVYLGAAEGGVWKTTDGGATWTPLTDFEPSLATGSIALDTSSCTGTPAHANAIYVGTGEEDFSVDSYYGADVLKSTDGGSTWTVFGASTFTGAVVPINVDADGPYVGAITLDPANSNIILAALKGFGSSFDEGIWRSTNGGNNWVHVLPATPYSNISATAVVFDQADPTGRTAYAALGAPAGTSRNGVYKSTEAGLTWTQVGKFSGTSLGRISIAIGPPIPGFTAGVLFVAIADAATFSENLLGVFKSTDGGITWTQLTDPVVTPPDGFCNPQCWYDMAIRVNPANPSLVFVGGSAGSSSNPKVVFRSTDGGITWGNVSANGAGGALHVDTHALAFSVDGKTLYVGNDGGAWSSTDVVDPAISPGSQHWNDLNATLDITQFYPGQSVHPSNPRISIGGTQDNGLQKHEDVLTMATPSLAWDDLGAACDGGYTALDMKIPSTVYVTCAYIPNSELIIGVSFVGGDLSGNNGFLVTSGIDGSDRGAFIPPLVMDPENPGRLLFGTFRLWQTTNRAFSWSAFSGDLTFGGGVLTAVAIAPSDANTIYTGASDSRIMITADGGVSWTGPRQGLPIQRSVTQVAVDPRVSTTAYVTFSGFSGFFGNDIQGHVFETTDAGATWKDISCTAANCGAPNSTDLPNIPVNDIVIDPDIANTLYVATDIGVFWTSNGGAAWSPVGADTLPRVVVLSLKIQEPSRTLRAATHGRGVWDFALGNPSAFGLTGISPVLAHVGDPGTLLTLIGNGFTGNSNIQWNGSPMATTFVSATELTAAIPSSDFAAGGAMPVSVTDPGRVGPTNSLVFTVLSPAPALLSISPTSTTAGTGPVQLAVLGSNFVGSTTVLFDGMNLPTTFNSSTSLTAVIPGSDLIVGQLADIDVFTSEPGGGPEPQHQIFTVNNPVPTISSLSPLSINGGVNGMTLTINGSNFNPSSIAQWNGSSRPTTFMSPTQVTASINWSDVVSPGSFPVTLLNPTPAGGTSNGIAFTVNYVDFVLGPLLPVSNTVTAGQAVSYFVPISPLAGGGTLVTLSCTNLPAHSTCGFSSNTALPSPGGSGVSVMINTTPRTAQASAPIGRHGPAPYSGTLLGLAITVLIAAILAAWALPRRLRPALAFALGILAVAVALAGCAGGGSGGSTAGGGGGSAGTPTGTYTVTVSGTSGPFTHSATATLVVE
jgi:photosystem II stability/assembly factor-like uncharacterized protein